MADNYEEKESYIGYYIFVIISAVIGFITLFAFSKIAVRVLVEKGLLGAAVSSNFLATIIAVVGVVLFIFLALLLKRFLKPVFMSEIFMYLYMGVLTTAVNILAFKYLLDIFAKGNSSESLGWKFAEILAFIIAVVFAFITNKIFVFKSTDFAPSIAFKEFGGFVVARIVTEIINILMMWILIDIKGFNAMLIKIIASVVVIVLNYIFSKFIVFKKKQV